MYGRVISRCDVAPLTLQTGLHFLYFISYRYCIIILSFSLSLRATLLSRHTRHYWFPRVLLIKGHNPQSALVRNSCTPSGVSLREEKERAVTYQELRHAEGTPTGKAQAPVDRKGIAGRKGGRAGGWRRRGRGLTHRGWKSRNGAYRAGSLAIADAKIIYHPAALLSTLHRAESWLSAHDALNT